MINEIDWMFKWFLIKNKYGEQVIYEPDVFAVAFANESYQQNIREFLETGKYHVFVDVGAAWGHFSIIASKHCDRVIAFEPHPMRYGFLLYNCRHIWNIDCRYEYVSCKGDKPTMGRIEEMVEERHTQEYNVPVITLDDFCYNNIKNFEIDFNYDSDTKILVKLDVEGSELKVLQDAKWLIEHPRTDWIIDIHNLHGIKNEDIISLFEKAGKKCWIQGQDDWCTTLEVTA